MNIYLRVTLQQWLEKAFGLLITTSDRSIFPRGTDHDTLYTEYHLQKKLIGNNLPVAWFSLLSFGQSTDDLCWLQKNTMLNPGYHAERIVKDRKEINKELF